MSYHQTLGTTKAPSVWHGTLLFASRDNKARSDTCSSFQGANRNCRALSSSSIDIPSLSPGRGDTHLVAEVDVGVPGEQQGHHVHVAVLRGEVQRGDALPRDGVGVRAVLQQRGGYVHLVLLGSYVQGCVTVLPTESTSLRAAHSAG